MATMTFLILCLAALTSLQLARGETFKMVPVEANITVAAATCVSLGGKLADLEDEAQAAAIHEYIRTTPDLDGFDRLLDFWIGRNDVDVEGSWVTADGSPSTNFGWCGDEPSGYQRHNCGNYQNYFKCLTDYYCENLLAFLCTLPDSVAASDITKA